MIRNICKDELFLARKSELAAPEDLPVAHDLLETLIAHQDGCVGMAANMIGVSKRIGIRPAKRWQTIKVQWQNEKFQTRVKTFTGWTAQIIQHEIDHCDGIII